MVDSFCVMSAPFKINLTYFKPSGKYYSTGEYFSHMQWMYQVFEEVKFKRDYGKLPGLISGFGKDFIIYVDSEDHPNGYPGLIVP